MRSPNHSPPSSLASEVLSAVVARGGFSADLAQRCASASITVLRGIMPHIDDAVEAAVGMGRSRSRKGSLESPLGSAPEHSLSGSEGGSPSAPWSPQSAARSNAPADAAEIEADRVALLLRYSAVLIAAALRQSDRAEATDAGAGAKSSSSGGGGGDRGSPTSDVGRSASFGLPLEHLASVVVEPLGSRLCAPLAAGGWLPSAHRPLLRAASTLIPHLVALEPNIVSRLLTALFRAESDTIMEERSVAYVETEAMLSICLHRTCGVGLATALIPFINFEHPRPHLQQQQQQQQKQHRRSMSGRHGGHPVHRQRNLSRSESPSLAVTAASQNKQQQQQLGSRSRTTSPSTERRRSHSESPSLARHQKHDESFPTSSAVRAVATTTPTRRRTRSPPQPIGISIDVDTTLALHGGSLSAYALPASQTPRQLLRRLFAEQINAVTFAAKLLLRTEGQHSSSSSMSGSSDEKHRGDAESTSTPSAAFASVRKVINEVSPLTSNSLQWSDLWGGVIEALLANTTADDQRGRERLSRGSSSELGRSSPPLVRRSFSAPSRARAVSSEAGFRAIDAMGERELEQIFSATSDHPERREGGGEGEEIKGGGGGGGGGVWGLSDGEEVEERERELQSQRESNAVVLSDLAMLLLPYAHTRLSNDLPKLLLVLKQLVVRIADGDSRPSSNSGSIPPRVSVLLRSTSELFGAVYALFPSHTISFLQSTADSDRRIFAVATRLLVTVDSAGVTSSNLILHPGVIDPNGKMAELSAPRPIATLVASLLPHAAQLADGNDLRQAAFGPSTQPGDAGAEYDDAHGSADSRDEHTLRAVAALKKGYNDVDARRRVGSSGSLSGLVSPVGSFGSSMRTPSPRSPREGAAAAAGGSRIPSSLSLSVETNAATTKSQPVQVQAQVLVRESRSEVALLRVELQRLRLRVSRTSEDAHLAATVAASAELGAVKSELARRGVTVASLESELTTARKQIVAAEKAKWKVSQHAQIAAGASQSRIVELEGTVRTLRDRCASLLSEAEALRRSRDVRATEWLHLTAMNTLLRRKVTECLLERTLASSAARLREPTKTKTTQLAENQKQPTAEVAVDAARMQAQGAAIEAAVAEAAAVATTAAADVSAEAALQHASKVAPSGLAAAVARPLHEVAAGKEDNVRSANANGVVALSSLREMELHLERASRASDEAVANAAMWREKAGRNDAQTVPLRKLISRVQREAADERMRLKARIERGRSMNRALERRILELSRRGVGIRSGGAGTIDVLRGGR